MGAGFFWGRCWTGLTLLTGLTGGGAAAPERVGVFLPGGEGVAGEFGVVVAGVLGDLVAGPFGEVDGLVFALEFDLGDAEAFVGAVEDVDLPFHAGVVDDVAGLVDEGSGAEGEESGGVGGRDEVLELEAGDPLARAFDREGGVVSGEADADAFVGVGKEVALAEAAGWADDLGAPGVADEEEFAFDFEGAVGAGVHGVEASGSEGGSHA